MNMSVKIETCGTTIKRLLLLLVLALLATPAFASKKKNEEAALKLTPESVKALVIVKGDSLDTKAEINSANVFKFKRGIFNLVWDDNFLRAYIDKKSGVTTIQVYQYITYLGDWRFYQNAAYEFSDGPKDADFISISRDISGCSGYTGCTLTEHMAFTITESELRAIATKYTPNSLNGWRFKFKAKSGEDWQDVIMPAEVAGFLMAIDEYRKIHNLPIPL